MADLYGKCGCNCGKCAAYIGNIKSEEDKQKCSEGWKKFLNIRFKADKCICLGCQSENPWKDGNVIPDRSCMVRKCAEKVQAKTCANCYSFPCSFLEERSKVDYSRAWVEKRVGGPISEQEYETYVNPFETFKNISAVRKSLREDEILPQKIIEPLKVKVASFSEKLSLSDSDIKILKTTYDFLVNVIKCNCETYIQQVINEKRIKATLVILWVFALYGQFKDNDYSKLIILSEDAADKSEFRSIVRKKDNYLHGVPQQVSFILMEYGLKIEHTALPAKKWILTLSVDDSNQEKEVLIGLKKLCEKLIEKYGEPEYDSVWKYKGEAFKKFEKADFNVI